MNQKVKTKSIFLTEILLINSLMPSHAHKLVFFWYYIVYYRINNYIIFDFFFEKFDELC